MADRSVVRPQWILLRAPVTGLGAGGAQGDVRDRIHVSLPRGEPPIFGAGNSANGSNMGSLFPGKMVRMPGLPATGRSSVTTTLASAARGRQSLVRVVGGNSPILRTHRDRALRHSLETSSAVPRAQVDKRFRTVCAPGVTPIGPTSSRRGAVERVVFDLPVASAAPLYEPTLHRSIGPASTERRKELPVFVMLQISERKIVGRGHQAEPG